MLPKLLFLIPGAILFFIAVVLAFSQYAGTDKAVNKPAKIETVTKDVFDSWKEPGSDKPNIRIDGDRNGKRIEEKRPAPIYQESGGRTAFVVFTEEILFANDPKREVIRDAELNGNTLILHTTLYFDSWSYRNRLQAVEIFWRGWAGVYSKYTGLEPSKDKGHLELRDIAGLQVGGTSSWKGAWVVKE